MGQGQGWEGAGAEDAGPESGAVSVSNAAISLRSGLAIATITGASFIASLAASGAAMTTLGAARAALITSLLLWPFAFGAHYCGIRWVGVTPTPVLDGLLGRGGLWVAAVRAPFGAVYAIPTVFLSIIAAAFLAPEITEPEGVPFANMDALQTFVANLLIVAEEFVFRLVLLFPLIALLGVRHVSRRSRPPLRVWIAIVLTGLLFGYIHIGNAALMGADETEYLLFALVQKGLVAGVIFGYVAWRYGLESSIICHYTANILLVLLGLALGQG